MVSGDQGCNQALKNKGDHFSPLLFTSSLLFSPSPSLLSSLSSSYSSISPYPAFTSPSFFSSYPYPTPLPPKSSYGLGELVSSSSGSGRSSTDKCILLLACYI